MVASLLSRMPCKISCGLLNGDHNQHTNQEQENNKFTAILEEKISSQNISEVGLVVQLLPIKSSYVRHFFKFFCLPFSTNPRFKREPVPLLHSSLAK